MADPAVIEPQPLKDLQTSIAAVGTAIAAELVALQAGMNAQGVNNSPAIEKSVQKIKDLVFTLNNDLAAPPPKPPVVGPVVTSISPTSGPAAGGTKVTLTGTGFTGAKAVAFSSIPASSFSVTNDTTIVATTPAAVAGVNLPVTVSTPSGESSLGPTWSFV